MDLSSIDLWQDTRRIKATPGREHQMRLLSEQDLRQLSTSGPRQRRLLLEHGQPEKGDLELRSTNGNMLLLLSDHSNSNDGEPPHQMSMW